MRYVTTCPLAINGDRVEAGTEVELSLKDAARFDVKDLQPVSTEPVAVPEPEPEVAVVDMTLAQLKAKATELELITTGSKADLTERITLHLAQN